MGGFLLITLILIAVALVGYGSIKHINAKMQTVIETTPYLSCRRHRLSGQHPMVLLLKFKKKHRSLIYNQS